MAAPHRVLDAELDGFAAVVLHDDAADLHAAFAPGVGMVGCSLRHRGAELLGRAAELRDYARSGATMGIPFLHPWANRLAGLRYSAASETVTLDPASPLVHLDEHGLPIHGLLAASPHWQVTERDAGAGGARLAAELDFGAHPELLAAFPFPHRVRLEATLAEGALTVATTVTPTSQRPVPIAFGFHPYLQIPDIPRAACEIVLPVERRLVLDERMLPTGETEPVEPFAGPIGDRTWDAPFDRLVDPPRFELRGGGRTLTMELLDGYGVAQVWVPAGRSFVCLEPMTAPANALGQRDRVELVAPGGRRRAAFRIAVSAGG